LGDAPGKILNRRLNLLGAVGLVLGENQRPVGWLVELTENKIAEEQQSTHAAQDSQGAKLFSCDFRARVQRWRAVVKHCGGALRRGFKHQIRCPLKFPAASFQRDTRQVFGASGLGFLEF
jgi:hypothetical protein